MYQDRSHFETEYRLPNVSRITEVMCLKLRSTFRHDFSNAIAQTFAAVTVNIENTQAGVDRCALYAKHAANRL